MKTILRSYPKTREIERVPAQRKGINEIDLINSVYETILKNGFTFSREQVINYYLSLKTKPFVILTGISGTGKTKITELFARAVCQDYDKQYLQLPVRPDWNDDRNLLGYYNPLTKKYLSTPFLKFIMDAVQDSENPYFVCLDEMNLARVEYYFSSFLSAMESTKKIKLHGETNIKTENGIEIPVEIEIPTNLFFTGTVNMDETTYRFSPKVLDRANTIEFNEIKLLTPRVPEGTLAIKPELIGPFKTYFLNDKVRKNGTSSEYTKWETENWDEQVGFLNSINEALEQYNLHFGYRIRDEIMRYLYFTEELNSDDFTTNIALDLQIKQKILPRIKGTDSIKKALELMRDIIQDKLQSIEKPQSIPKLDQMMGALDNGYTDFYQ